MTAALAQKPPAPTDNPQTHYDAAHTFQVSGDLEHAATEYNAFLAGTLHSLANAYANAGSVDRAHELFEQARALAPNDANLSLDEAALRIQQGDLPDAHKLAEAALKKDPSNEKARTILAQVLFAEGDYKGAKDLLEQVVVASPSFDVGYLLGLTYIKLNDLARARLLFDDMASGLGDSAQIHLLFGQAYGKGEWEALDAAIAEIQKAIAKDPKLRGAHYFLALAYLSRDGESAFPTVVQELQAELKVNPDDPRTHYLLGYAALKQHDTKTAEIELSKAIALDPKNPDPLIYLGQLYADADRDQEAEATMRKAIAQSQNAGPNDYLINRAHYVLGRLLLKKGDREGGQKELEISKELRNRLNHPVETQSAKGQKFADAAAFAPDSTPGTPTARPVSQTELKKVQAFEDQLRAPVSDAYNNLGVIAAGKKDFLSAATSFQNAAEWNPALETVDRNWGMAAFYAEEYDQAIAPLSRHLTKQSDDSRARSALGLSYFMTKNYPRTLETLRPIASQIEDDPGLSYAYAVSTLKSGDYAEGIRRLKALETTGANAAELHALLAEAYADERDHNAAVDEYRKSIALDPNQPQVRASAGMALLRAGRASEAVDEFRASLKLRPADPDTKYHLAFALIEAQHKDEAMSLLNEVIAQDPKYADAYYELGKLQLEHGDTKSAISSLEAGTKLSPESDYIHYQLAMAYRRDSRASDADRELKLYQDLKDRHRGRDVSQ